MRFGTAVLREGLKNGQLRIGSTLWENPDLVYQNSPIFKADKVVTPLLIMHNKGDVLVNWMIKGSSFTTRCDD